MKHQSFKKFLNRVPEKHLRELYDFLCYRTSELLNIVEDVLEDRKIDITVSQFLNKKD